MAFTERIEV
jgi:hypothetical protein